MNTEYLQVDNDILLGPYRSDSELPNGWMALFDDREGNTKVKY